MEGEAAVLELRLVLKTRGHSVGWGSGPPPSTKNYIKFNTNLFGSNINISYICVR